MGRHQLAEFELYVLMAVALLDDNAYGVTIMREIEERARRPVTIGAIYATLARLEAKGMVRFTVSDPRPIPGGRARKYVHLTRGGTAAYREAAAGFLRMVRGLEPGLAR